MNLFFSGAHWSQNLLIINLWQHCVGERERRRERECVRESERERGGRYRECEGRVRERERGGDIESVRGECVTDRERGVGYRECVD